MMRVIGPILWRVGLPTDRAGAETGPSVSNTERPTSNIQRSTSKIPDFGWNVFLDVGCSMLNVGCSARRLRPAGTRALHLFCLALFAAALPARAADILLAAATDAELQPLIRRLVDARAETRAAWTFWTGTLAGRSVVLVRTEGDPLNAVAATTLAIRRHSPRLVVTFGSARAHDPALRSGDVVVSKAFVAFDGIISDPLPLGGSVKPLAWKRLPHAVMTPGEKENYQVEFPADPGALATATKLKPARGKLVTGVLGSAHQVNREADRLAYLHQQWGTSTEDFESAHVAGCALLLGVPVIGLRVVDGTPAESAALALQFLEGSK
jgi:adenosylhomocysteine nucleosidase